MPKVQQVILADQLTDTKKNNDNVVVMFSAVWCGPCKMIKPLYEQLSDEMADIVFLYVNVENFDDPQKEYLSDVRGVPTFNFYQKGIKVNSFSGASKDKLTTALSSLKPETSN